MALLLLLVLVFQAESRAEINSTDLELYPVPKPTNIQIKAYNFNTVLSWDYPTMSETPLFIVQVMNYEDAEWIDACNTSQHYCNIFSTISDPSISLWARIKARLGQKESDDAMSEEFILCRHGEHQQVPVIGTDKPLVTRNEEKGGPGSRLSVSPSLPTRCCVLSSLRVPCSVQTALLHLLRMRFGGMNGARDRFGPFCALLLRDARFVLLQNKRSYAFSLLWFVPIQSSYISDVEEDNCNETQCHLIVPVSSLNSEYCASAEGSSEIWGVSTNPSREVCVTAFDGKRMEDSVWISVVAAVLLSVVLIVVLVCCYTKKINPFKRQSIMLPKSLLSVVKNASSSETKSESKCVSPITYQPIVSENEKMVWEEHLSPATISDTPPEDNLEKMEHHETLQLVTPEGEISDKAPDSPLTPVLTENSVHSDSNQSETCVVTLSSCHSRNGSDSGVVDSQSLSDSELPPSSKPEPKTEGQESVMPRNTTTSFGYDKPHVLVDLLVDEGGKESLIGYRLTADSKEFS
ncbi:interferon gamma receptor 1 [Suricata suricatta]|uniref:interferon gamma receptor 1 n=1 Tax=Suricata suricatta TaxID=37032 RepID=UPI001155C868|nr:interferon gamma receptor 1 [Suricata suricatta]